jgi:hypothetical protein
MQVAGPGGVLAVLPAVQLNDYRQALVYLAFFCVTSALTMGKCISMLSAVSCSSTTVSSVCAQARSKRGASSLYSCAMDYTCVDVGARCNAVALIW